MQEQTSGEFGGLGIEITEENETVKVVSPIEGTPAERAGLMAGDLITHVNGESIVGMDQSKAVKLLKGPPGTEVTITVKRSDENIFDVTIVRDKIVVHPVRAEARGKIGYLRLLTFSEKAGDEVKEALQELKDELGPDLEGLILDLRSNPGGLLDQAVDVSDLFLSRGEIVSTRGRVEEQIQRYNAQRSQMAPDVPIVVLINGGSASASEIVAAALQDRGRATVIGTKSFGKGSVQTILPIRNGSKGAIRLTTAHYYTPSGRSIHEKGVEPDLELALFEEDEEPRPLRFGSEEDRQYQRALEVVKGMAEPSRVAGAEANPTQ